MQKTIWTNPYVLAVITVAGSMLARFALDPLLHQKNPLFMFVFAVVISALYGRRRAGIFATFLSIPIADYFFIEPRNSFIPTDLWGEVSGLLLFVTLGISVTMIIEGFHRTRENLARTGLELQRSELRFRTLAATVPETLFTAAANGKWDYVSPRFCDYTGMAPEQARKDWMKAIHPQDRESAVDKWTAAIKQGIEFEATFRIRNSNGEYRWFEAHANPDREPDGRIGQWTGVCSDIHQHKLLEQALAKRTEELVASNEDFQNFAYRVGHDLKEPMRMIGMYSQMLVERNGERVDEESKMFTRYILNGVDRVESQMRDLLEYARAGALEIKSELIDFNTILDSAIANLHPVILETGATVSRDAMPSLVANPDRIRSVFQNLIGNAVKYRSARPPRIHIGARTEANEWIFSVEDNGIGFEMKEAGRIFGAFERVSRSAKVQGSGLGLAIVKRIVELKGGRVWAESKVGEGSTFFFALPRSLEKMGPEPAEHASESVESQARSKARASS